MNALEAAYALVEVVATPLAIAAWPVAFGLTLLLGRGLRGQLGPHRRAVWSVFVFSLVVHLLDTGLTLYITPDLALEGNPLWQAILRLTGLPFAIVWGATGKVLVAVLHAECAAHYLRLRDRLQPTEAPTFLAYVQNFGGSQRVSPARVLALLAFLAAGFAPFFLYISALNAIGGIFEAFTLYDQLPDPFVAAFVWGLALAPAFYVVGWRAHRARAAGAAG